MTDYPRRLPNPSEFSKSQRTKHNLPLRDHQSEREPYRSCLANSASPTVGGVKRSSPVEEMQWAFGSAEQPCIRKHGTYTDRQRRACQLPRWAHVGLGWWWHHPDAH